MSNCPDCDSPLYGQALKCRCGWKRPAGQAPEPAPFIPCAWDGCSYPAVCRVKAPTGWANLCRSHYDSHYGRVAREYCEERGLTRQEGEDRTGWLARIAAWAREHPPFQGRQAVRMREPGEDDE